ncbi:hypothetical protein EMGBS8_14040 [Verrucomicrobiota bacterium]|nr:hypothetical protein EMGBS8_14040 [Verrucomicrobiota bacterium]
MTPCDASGVHYIARAAKSPKSSAHVVGRPRSPLSSTYGRRRVPRLIPYKRVGSSRTLSRTHSHTPRVQTHILIRTSHVPGGVALEIQDDGAGVAAVDLPRLFDRFYRTDKSRRAGGVAWA